MVPGIVWEPREGNNEGEILPMLVGEGSGREGEESGREGGGSGREGVGGREERWVTIHSLT